MLIKKLILTILTDFVPLILFILVYDRRGFITGTKVLIVATLFAIVFSYYKDKRIPLLPVYIALVTSVFGMLTIGTHDPKYIQMRDTFYDGSFALLLIVTLYSGKMILQDMFGHIFVGLDRKDWVIVTWNWIIHFFFLALTNEIIRRFFQEYWLDYKSVVILVTILHGMGLVYYFRNKIYIKSKPEPHD